MVLLEGALKVNNRGIYSGVIKTGENNEKDSSTEYKWRNK